MKDYPVSASNLQQFMSDLQDELSDSPHLVVSTQNAGTGKWGMAKLWRAWMATTAEFMAANGCTMPLMVSPISGKPFGKRKFEPEDAHLLFTSQWLGLDKDGTRLSWSKKGRDGMRPATKGERFLALTKHENYCIEKGITLFQPRDSEYQKLLNETNK